MPKNLPFTQKGLLATASQAGGPYVLKETSVCPPQQSQHRRQGKVVFMEGGGWGEEGVWMEFKLGLSDHHTKSQWEWSLAPQKQSWLPVAEAHTHIFSLQVMASLVTCSHGVGGSDGARRKLAKGRVSPAHKETSQWNCTSSKQVHRFYWKGNSYIKSGPKQRDH